MAGGGGDFVLRDSEFPPLDTAGSGISGGWRAVSGAPVVPAGRAVAADTPTDGMAKVSEEDSITTVMGKSILTKMKGRFPEWYIDKLMEFFATYEYVCLQKPEMWDHLVRTPPPLAFVSFGGDYAMLAHSEREQRQVVTMLGALTISVMTLFSKKLPRTSEQCDVFRQVDEKLGSAFDGILEQKRQKKFF